ncbi:MAG TPA: hypothetical protein ENJ56_06125 [Anaerolineae bacterium]|nr:hypothetical protein [Anaerolineae bacterium]
MRLQIRYLFAVACLFVVACRGQVESIAQQTLPPPTLTSLPTDWAQLTVAATDSAEITPSIPPTATSTPTALPPTSTPIPTQTATVTVTPSPTATPEPTATIITATLTPTPSPEEQARTLLLANRPIPDGFVNKSQLKEQIKTTQTHIRDLAFLLTQAASTQTLDCPKFAPTYRALQVESPSFRADETLQIANQHYNQAVEQGILDLNPIYEACVSQAATGDFQPISVTDLDEDSFNFAFAQRELITKDINDALLWINADDAIMQGLYSDTQALLAQLGEHYEDGTTARCDEITQIYSQLSQSPQVIAPNGRRLDAYLNYLDALSFIDQGSTAINLYCTERLTHNNGEPDEDGTGLPLPPDKLEVAKRTWLRALTAISTARELLATPEPTNLPDVSAEILDIQAGPGSNDYTIRIKYAINAGTPPYSVLIGGFTPGPDNIFTIAHTCDQDFLNMVVVFDSLGDRYQSVKLSASGKDVCP